MKKYLLALFTLSILHFSPAQDIKVIRQTDQKFHKTKSKAPFHYLESKIDTTHLTYVATLEVSGLNNPSLFSMYKKMKDQAKKMGANAFKLRKYSQATILLEVDIYKASEDAINVNNASKPENTIYIFGADPFEKTSYHTFEMNGIGKSIKNGTYYKYKLHEGEQIKLKKGTITGTVMWVKWKPGQLPNYYSIHGFTDEVVVKRTTQSESFKTGKFAIVESGLAGLLTNILEEKD